MIIFPDEGGDMEKRKGIFFGCIQAMPAPKGLALAKFSMLCRLEFLKICMKTQLRFSLRQRFGSCRAFFVAAGLLRWTNDKKRR